MFDAVRSKRWFVQIFLGLIALSFALWGVESYVRDMGAGDAVAKVGDSKITPQEFQQALREQQDQLRNALGANYNPAMFESAEARRALLDQLINQRLLVLEARKGKMAITEQQIQEVIRSIPSLQENGQFSMAKYESMVQAQGYSPAGFEQQLRQDLLLQQLAGGIGESGVLSAVAFDGLHGLLAEKREFAISRLAPEAFAAKVTPSDAEIKAFYEANRKDFEVPEQLRAEFVVLSMDQIKTQISVTPQEAKAWYDTHKDKYTQAEERRASHILITADAKGPADARSKAKAQAEDLLKQIKAAPGEFAQLAKKHSQDPGSAENGGDLGFFGRGMMVKPFEDAVFALKEGALSEVVESDFGYHVIKVTGIKAGKEKAFEEVRAEIEAELKQQNVGRKYAEAAEAFANLVYEQADSLQPAADKLKLPRQETAWLIKGMAPQAPSPFANAKLFGALFGEDALKNKRNTEAVEVAPNTLVAARVIEHKPAVVKALDEVKSAIQARLVRDGAAKLAQQAGEAKLAELQQGKDAGVSWSGTQSASRLALAGLPAVAAKAVFKLPAAKLPAYAGVTLPDGSYALYKVVAVDSKARLAEGQAKALQAEIGSMQAQAEFGAYLAGLRNRYKIDINTAALEAR